MRRNRQFRAGDIMMILDVDSDFLMPIFRALELCGYLDLEEGSHTFKDRHYKLLKNTGIRSPSVLKKPCDIVKDENTCEEFILDGNHPVQIFDKLKLLDAMKSKDMCREDIAFVAGFHTYSSKTIRYLDEFTKAGIMIQKNRKGGNGRRNYTIDQDKRKALIDKLKGGGNDGSRAA